MPENATIGEIYMVGFGFSPRGQALCQGQLLAISEYEAVYAVLGTTFGGDGQQTFGLPDLRGRMPIGWGQGPGLTNRLLGQMGGEENTTLFQTHMPMHTHSFNAVNQEGTASSPAGAFLANRGALDKDYGSAGITAPLNNAAIVLAGGNQPHDNMPPYLALNFYIVLEGIFPSQQ